MFVGAGSLLVSGWESKWPLATPINCISSALSKASFVLWTFKIDFSSCGMQKVCFGGKPPFLLPNYWGISNFRHLGNSKYIFIWLVTSAATGNQVFPTVSAQVCFPLGQDLTTLMLTLCCLAHFWSVRNTYASFVPTNSGGSGWPQLGHLSVDFSLVVRQLASGPLHLQEEVRHQALSLCNGVVGVVVSALSVLWKPLSPVRGEAFPSSDSGLGWESPHTNETLQKCLPRAAEEKCVNHN